jgi:ABC-type antimicrobial peptide transport system permease subunit
MKMVLTRLGVNSRVVITGDKTQVDLPKREDSGLIQVERILPGIEGIFFSYLQDTDVVRHRENVFLDRMISMLSAGFAVLATLLAGVGLYGVLAYTVTQRTREIGVRMALGAGSERVRHMVLGQVSRMALVGGVIGLVGAYFLGRGAQALLFEVEGTDPWVLAGVMLALFGVALGAGYLPALRASKVDPMEALRHD